MILERIAKKRSIQQLGQGCDVALFQREEKKSSSTHQFQAFSRLVCGVNRTRCVSVSRGSTKALDETVHSFSRITYLASRKVYHGNQALCIYALEGRSSAICCICILLSPRPLEQEKKSPLI